jgi:hypothetical protein
MVKVESGSMAETEDGRAALVPPCTGFLACEKPIACGGVGHGILMSLEGR